MMMPFLPSLFLPSSPSQIFLMGVGSMRRHSPLFLLRLNESREITIAVCRGRRSVGWSRVRISRATLTLVYVRVLFSIQFCRRKHNGFTLPGYVPCCEAYTMADWTPLQISNRSGELACRSKELREWHRQNHCATRLLTCKNGKSRSVKV